MPPAISNSSRSIRSVDGRAISDRRCTKAIVRAPEGFYTITSELMNANSNYYLAINTGFPNTFDKANDRDGCFLMIHGDCASSGCYAMTDEQMGEIYSLARDSLPRRPPVIPDPGLSVPLDARKSGAASNQSAHGLLANAQDRQRSFRGDASRTQGGGVRSSLCIRCATSPNSSNPLVFNPTGKCPAFVVNPQIARPALEKQRADEVEYAQLVEDNVSVAPIYSGLDGGMNKVFLAGFRARVISFARVFPPASQLPQLPPVAWADNDGSLAGKLFGVLFRLKPAPKEQIASTNSPTQEPGVDSPTAGLTATPTAKPMLQMEAVAAANPNVPRVVDERAGQERSAQQRSACEQTATDRRVAAETCATAGSQRGPGDRE